MSEPALKRQKVLNNFDNSESKTEHEDFLEKLNDYEPGLIGIIKYYIKTYTFESNKELKDAVKLWNDNKDKCIEKYGHISDWDTSKITDMSHLFELFMDFNSIGNDKEIYHKIFNNYLSDGWIIVEQIEKPHNKSTIILRKKI